MYHEAASTINSFLQQMKAASDSVTAAIQAGADQGKAAVQEAGQEMAASTETNTKEQKEAYGKVAGEATKAYKAIGTAINESIAELNQYTIAMNGLDAAAKRQGLSSVETVKTMNSVTDAVFGATDASTALGHLFSGGLSADKAANMINRFKEAAALSRSENISFTDSIVAAAKAVEQGDSRGLKSIGIRRYRGRFLVSESSSLDRAQAFAS